MSLLTKCYSCTAEILFPKGESTATCIYCGRINARPKSQANELTLMKFANERRAFGEFDAAANAYQKVLQRSLDEHEARWGLLLCKYGVMYVEDARTGKRLPTCRRSLPTSLCDEPDFQLACSQAPAEVREAYRRDGEYIDAIQREIRRLNATTEKYDIFICYKEKDECRKRTSDSVLAQNLYQQLKLHGFNAFYAPVSLNKQLGANYEAAIYHAVETARVMLVLSTKPEYLETTWVRSEWKRYLDRIDAGEDKLLIPLYRDFTPDKLPEEFTSRYLQGLNMGDFGFMTYLESFLSEIFHGDEPKSAPETSKLDNLLDRGFMELEDGDFAAAIECFTEALNTDVKSPRANLGMAMAELQAEDGNALVKICLARDDWDSSKYIRRADRFADAETAALFKRIRQAREDEQARIEAEKAREAEERARREAEERARREAEERARREAEERARREAEERARREAEERARQEAEERARREAEERARQEAEERARQEAEEKILNDFEFDIVDGGAVITGYSGDATGLRIPDRLKGFPVVKIGDEAFKDCSELKSVIIPDGVTSIGDSAFKKCSSLFKVTIPDSVTSIEGGAFWGCSGLKEIIIPDSVASIGIGAFCGCFVLKEIIIPDSVTSIGSGAFWGCSALTVVRLPAGLTSICDEAFKDCDNLTSINIPDRVTTIGDSAFWGCSSLADVRLPAGLITIGSNAFWDCSSLADVRLPAGLTTIGSNAFWSCKGLTSVAIPESVKQIKENAFEWCANLKSILVGANTTVEDQGPDSPEIKRRPAAGAQASARTEPKKPQGDARREYHQQLRAKVRAIAEKDAQTARAEAEAVFRGVADAPAKDFAYETASDGTITILEYRGSAKVVAIPAAINGKRVAAIGESAFAIKKRGLLAKFKTSTADRHDWNKNLQAVRIPGGVRIGKCAFYCCGALKHVLLEGPCETEEDAFGLCNHLEQIDLPEGVCQLGKTAFGFAALRSIRVPDSVRVLNYGALHYMSIENIYLPDGLTTIGPGAFESTHIRSIYVPDGVRSLGYSAFYACRKLTDVYLPDGLTSIENNAFWNCEDLSEIHIPESVTSIGVGAFRGCKKLKSIRVSRKAKVEDQQNTGMKIEYYD